MGLARDLHATDGDVADHVIEPLSSPRYRMNVGRDPKTGHVIVTDGQGLAVTQKWSDDRGHVIVAGGQDLVVTREWSDDRGHVIVTGGQGLATRHHGSAHVSMTNTVDTQSTVVTIKQHHADADTGQGHQCHVGKMTELALPPARRHVAMTVASLDGFARRHSDHDSRIARRFRSSSQACFRFLFYVD